MGQMFIDLVDFLGIKGFFGSEINRVSKTFQGLVLLWPAGGILTFSLSAIVTSFVGFVVALTDFFADFLGGAVGSVTRAGKHFLGRLGNCRIQCDGWIYSAAILIRSILYSHVMSNLKKLKGELCVFGINSYPARIILCIIVDKR